ncbi:MAG: L-rhamnose isomerase [Verrucomicrobiia bacterium]
MSLFTAAKDSFLSLQVDAERALEILSQTPISVHCWQGDDVSGFESPEASLGGGLAVTGNYPGKARTLDELRADLEKVFSLLPGRHRLNLHAIYGDFSAGPVARDEIAPSHFASWIDWAKTLGVGIDFNPTCFGHPLAEDGFTLSHPVRAVRDFWIRHCSACREIGAHIGNALGSTTVTNIWIPDGTKDRPGERMEYRARLAESLDTIFAKPLDSAFHLDAVESKLFGIGSESFVVGTHEFYLGYAVKNQLVLCLDAGHFHPTENLGDKISALLLFLPRLLLHVSRGVRWDSDHVVILDDMTKGIMSELVRCDALHRTHIGLDFFDASVNRIAAYTIGTRSAQKALLQALLEPRSLLLEAEQNNDRTALLALHERAASMPWSIVWDEFCTRMDVPRDDRLLEEIRCYEREVLSKRV